MSLLTLQNLSIKFDTIRGDLNAVDRISLSVDEGETLGIVGESGCGKSISSLALMGLLPPTATVTADKMQFDQLDLLNCSESQKRKMRGKDIAMIFQDPMTSLNPCFTVGYQIVETLKIHVGGTVEQLKERAIDLLREVGIPAPETRLNAFPHQLSGGMSQRVMIAMAIACNPRLLIADEPTTALDVTIQAQILDLLKRLQKEHQMGLILITHDIGVVAETADRILVMYAGQVVETGVTSEVIENPQHPYTQGLLECLPGAYQENSHRQKLPSIPGLVPDLVNRPDGCQMNPRCRYAKDLCREQQPELEAKGTRLVKCHYPVGESPMTPLKSKQSKAKGESHATS